MKTMLTRLAAGAVALSAVLAACETARLTGNGVSDTVPPGILIEVANAKAVPGTKTDTVDVVSTLHITVKGGDDLSLLNFQDVVTFRDTVRHFADTTFHAATPVYTDDITLTVNSPQSGERVKVVASVRDGNGNPVRPGSSDSIRIFAADSGGIGRIGYQVLRGANKATPTIYKDTAATINYFTTSLTYPFSPNFNLPPGTYALRGYAYDRA